jgi:hypothetical protein
MALLLAHFSSAVARPLTLFGDTAVTTPHCAASDRNDISEPIDSDSCFFSVTLNTKLEVCCAILEHSRLQHEAPKPIDNALIATRALLPVTHSCTRKSRIAKPKAGGAQQRFSERSAPRCTHHDQREMFSHDRLHLTRYVGSFRVTAWYPTQYRLRHPRLLRRNPNLANFPRARRYCSQAQYQAMWFLTAFPPRGSDR